jgi:hypothetical protein
MDELAAAAGAAPLAFRRKKLSDPRAFAVLDSAAEMIGWEARANSVAPLRQGGVQTGRGIAYMTNRRSAQAEAEEMMRPVGEIVLEAGEARVGLAVEYLSNILLGGFCWEGDHAELGRMDPNLKIRPHDKRNDEPCCSANSKPMMLPADKQQELAIALADLLLNAATDPPSLQFEPAVGKPPIIFAAWMLVS